MKKKNSKLNFNKEYVTKTTPKRMLLDSVIATLVVGIIIIFCLTYLRDFLIALLNTADTFKSVMEYTLMTLPFIFVVAVCVKVIIPIAFDILKK